MSLIRLLQENYYDLIEEGNAHLHRAHLRRYCNSPREENTLRIKVFLDLIMGSITKKSLKALIEYTEKTAEERFYSGFDLCEIQRALNGLKKSIWKKIVTEFKPDEHADSIALISTVIDEIKDTLACRYLYCTRKRSTTELKSLAS